MNIEDNFLEDKDFKHLQDQMTCNYFPWYYVDKVATKDDNDFFYMGHLIFDQYKIIGPWGFDLVQPMIDKLKPKSIVRIKANLPFIISRCNLFSFTKSSTAFLTSVIYEASK